MRARTYDFPRNKSSARGRAASGDGGDETTRDLHTLAEEARKLSIMRTCRIIARR